MNNTEFAQKDKWFNIVCRHACIPATPRQASKFRRGMGAAYKLEQNIPLESPRR